MEIQEIEGVKAVKFAKACVAVITYTLDAQSVIQEIGIVKEKNPHFDSGFSQNVVMGTVEPEDTSLLQRAMIELKEEAGIEVTDSLKWSYLDEIYTSKVSPDPIYVFAVNVSEATLQTPKGDNTGEEEIISFELLPVQDALKIADSVLLASFFKLFMTLYQKEIKE